MWNLNCPLLTVQRILHGTCTTVQRKPVSTALNAESLVHTATLKSSHISISACERIEVAGISNVVVQVTIFPNIVL